MFNKISFVLLLLLISFTSYAGNTNKELEQAQALLKSGKASESLALLKKEHDPASRNIQEWFLMAMAAKADQRPREASAYFEEVVALSPENSGRAKLELAELSYGLGDVEQAKIYLNDVKAAQPPVKVGENIDKFLGMIDEHGAPKRWSVTVSAGWMYDSNVNAGPSTDTVLIYGLPFVLSESAKESEDSAWLASIGFDHNAGLTDNIGWQSALSASFTDYQDIDQLDSIVYSGSTGPTFRFMGDYVLSVPIVGDITVIGHNESYYSVSYGVAPQLRYNLSNNLALNLGSTISKKLYRASSHRNTDNYSLSPSFFYKMSRTGFFKAGVSVGAQDASLRANTSNNYRGANAMVGWVFFNALQMNTNISYTDTEYSEKEVAYDKKRHDKSIRYGLSATYNIKSIGTGLNLSFYRTENNSNIEMNEYDRNQLTVSFRKIF